MATTYGRKLACDLILSHFGELVQKVCQCLVYRGQLSLGDIARYSELNIAQLRNCLLVLVQHNCVQGFKVEHDGAGVGQPRVSTSYIAICDNILHRMRFPKFLLVVREDLGEEAEALVEGLFEHGRLTLEQIIQRAAARAGKAEGEVAKELKAAFVKLLNAHYIERCPTPEPSLHPKGVLEPPKKAARGAVGRGRAIIDTSSEEQRIVSAAAPSETERFQVPISLIAMGASVPDVELGETTSVGQKRKHEALQMDAKTAAAVDEKEVLWRVNFEEFIRRLRHQVCVALVRSRVDTGTGTVLAAMLEATRMQETSGKQHFSASLSMDAITQAVRSTPDGQHMTLDRIRGAVQQLAGDSVGYLARAGERGGPAEGGNNYVINMHKIIELCRRNEVEGIVLQRYGKECCRIFRLLALKGQLEQKQIGEKAMVPKDVRELLYQLLKDHYVQVQNKGLFVCGLSFPHVYRMQDAFKEIAKTTEHVASKSIHLWRVNYRAVLHQVLDDMYHAAANLGLRLAHELEKEQEVLGLLRQIQVTKAAGADAHVPHVTLTNVQHEQVKRIKLVTTVLEASLLKLDDGLLLFHDF